MKAMMAIIAIILILLPVPVQAGEWFTWDETNTKMHVPYTILHIADWSQTLYIAEHPGGFSERNGFLGDHPSGDKVNAYMLGSYLLSTFMIYALPEDASYGFQAVIIIDKAHAVHSNYAIGVGFQF
jgi:hypothetical protein